MCVSSLKQCYNYHVILYVFQTTRDDDEVSDDIRCHDDENDVLRPTVK